MLPLDDATGVTGRDDELAHLVAALERARADRPSVVFVEAEAGMGKSALVQAFASAVPAGVRFLAIRCDSFEENVAFAAADRLLDPSAATGTSADLTSEVEVGRSLLMWIGSMQAGTDDALVLVVDDAQWMDPASTRALRFALHRLRADRVLTVLARRPPVGTDPWRGLHDDLEQASVLRLGPLTTHDVGPC